MEMVKEEEGAVEWQNLSTVENHNKPPKLDKAGREGGKNN